MLPYVPVDVQVKWKFNGVGARENCLPSGWMRAEVLVRRVEGLVLGKWRHVVHRVIGRREYHTQAQLQAGKLVQWGELVEVL